MVGCKQISADAGIPSDVGLAKFVALLAGTVFFPAHVALAVKLALIAAGHGIANADYGTTSGGATSGTPCSTHHR